MAYDPNQSILQNMQNYQSHLQSSPAPVSTVTQQNPNGDVVERQISRQSDGIVRENIGVVNNQSGFASKTIETIANPNTKAFESTIQQNGQTVNIAAGIKNGQGSEMIQTVNQNGQKSVIEKPINEQQYNQLLTNVQNSNDAKSIFTGSVSSQPASAVTTQQQQISQQPQINQPSLQTQPNIQTSQQANTQTIIEKPNQPQITNVNNYTTINQQKPQKQNPEKQEQEKNPAESLKSKETLTREIPDEIR